MKKNTDMKDATENKNSDSDVERLRNLLKKAVNAEDVPLSLREKISRKIRGN